MRSVMAVGMNDAARHHQRLCNDVDAAIAEVTKAAYAHDSFPGPGTEAALEIAQAKLEKAQALLRVWEDR